MTSAEPAPAAAAAVLDGTGLTCAKVRKIARDGQRVAVGPAGLRRAGQARAVVQRAVASRPVYGRTTGVGANRWRVEPPTGCGRFWPAARPRARAC